jgi:hypothetical protein
MSEIRISVNQLASYRFSSDAKKKSIIKQQKNPPEILVARYALAKSRMKRAFSKQGNIQPILDGISELKSRIPTTDWQKNDREVSIQALERFVKMKLPDLLANHPYEVLDKPKEKSIYVQGIEIIISPDLVIKMNIAGEEYFGAVKFHVSKSDAFDREKSRYVTTCLYKYLEKTYGKSEVIIHPGLCLSVDVFADATRNAPSNINEIFQDVESTCVEIKDMWNKTQ